MTRGMYRNTGSLVRFSLRRDRVRIPAWLLAIAFFTVAVVFSFTDLYGSDEERQEMAETMKNPAMTAMVGKGYGIDTYTIGAMTAHQMLLLTAVVVAIMSILLVVRHTRADEEDGRIEVIRSLPTGRLSPLHATVLVVSGVNVLLALVIGFGLYALRIESVDLQGSLTYGAALGVTGILFTAVTAVFVQLSENARGATGFSLVVLGIAYLLRAVGDVSNETLSWLSPLGWVLESRAFVENNGWPLLLTFGVAILLFIFAYYLNAIRDLEAGFLPARPGRRHASPLLKDPFGLLLRIQRTGLMAWAVGMYVLGASYGSVLGDLESFFAEIDMMQELMDPVGGFSLTDQFITMLMSVMAMIATVPAIMAMLKLIGEEKKGRTDHLLSRVVSRCRLLAGSLVLSVATGFVMLSLAGMGLWSTGNAVVEDGLQLGTMYGAAMVYLPAMWVMIGIAVLLIGFIPKWTGLIWGYLIYSFIVVYMGGLFDFPEWLENLSPFGYIPQLPVENMDYPTVIGNTIIALIVMMVGFMGYRKRDMV